MENTNLGTLGKVLDILRSEGIVDIPETDSPFDVAFTIVLELEREKLVELLQAITGDSEIKMSDEEAVRTLENFFTGLGKNLKKFVEILTREFNTQRDLAIQKMNQLIDKATLETITETDLSSLLKMVSQDVSTN